MYSLKVILCVCLFFDFMLVSFSSPNVYPQVCGTVNKHGICVCTGRTNPEKDTPEFTVDCSATNLNEMPEENFTDVAQIDVSMNSLTMLKSSPVIINSEEMRVLRFSSNQISSIDTEYFKKVPNLEELYLDRNLLTELDSQVFKSLSKLRILDLSFNRLAKLGSSVFAPMTDLTQLSLGYNEEIGNLLVEKIKRLPKPGGIFSTDLGITKKLKKINLDSVNLSSSTLALFDEDSELEAISVAYNLFKEIPEFPATIEELDISGNNFTFLSARYLNYHSLKSLTLDRLKELSMIDRYAFYNLQSLEHLSMKNCPNLKNFEPLAFGVLVDDYRLKLKTLDLSGCRLETINSNYSKLFQYIDWVDLSFNPWICDCSLQWLRDKTSIYENTENMRCASPPKLKGQHVLKVEGPSCLDEYSVMLQKILLPILSVLILALICVVVYLIYMGPINYKSRRSISPYSPYRNVLINEH